VHDVLAHQLETAKETRLRFFRRFAAAGFDFVRYNQRGVEAERQVETVEGVALAIRHQASVGAGTGGAKHLVKGLRIRATDTDLDLGEGDLVEGPAIALLLVLCGRRVALDELGGAGTEALSGRL
jgi:hypothetical protein